MTGFDETRFVHLSFTDVIESVSVRGATRDGRIYSEQTPIDAVSSSNDYKEHTYNILPCLSKLKPALFNDLIDSNKSPFNAALRMGRLYADCM